MRIDYLFISVYLIPILMFPNIAVCQDASGSEVTWDQVRPVFQKRCFACHRGEQARGGLDLSSVASIKAGSTSGAAIVSGKPEESMVYTLPAHLENPQMPPNSAKMPQRELDLIFGWIQGGLSERVTVATTTATNRPTRPAMVRPAMVPLRPSTIRVDRPKDSMTAAGDTASQDAASPDKKALSTGSPKSVHRLSKTVTTLAASPTASLVAIAGHREVMIYRWTDQTLIATIPFPAGDVCTMRFSRDGNILLVGGGVGGASGKVVGFDVATGTAVFTVGEEPDVVMAADLSPNGLLAALGGPSRTVRIFNTVTGEKVAEIRKHTDWVLSLAFSNDGLLLATGDRFGSLQIWEAATGLPFHTLRGHLGAIHGLVWSSDSNTVTSAGEDGTLRTWDMHAGTQLQALPGELGGLLSTDADATGNFVAGGREARIGIWHGLEERRCEITMKDEVVELAITQDGTHIVAADVTGTVALYEIKSGQQTGEFILP